MSNQALTTLNKSTITAEIVSLILANVRDIAEEQDIEIPEALEENTPLFGKYGLFDSLGLVSLVVALEEAIADKYGVTVSLADEKAMSQKHSPYRSISYLAEYASSLIPAET
jgi:acyl carrier protein